VRQAAKEGQDVVLIDTAGRMQDNERLMQALAKLVSVNRPDLILFVGEGEIGSVLVLVRGVCSVYLGSLFFVLCYFVLCFISLDLFVLVLFVAFVQFYLCSLFC
jgi:hypothetical protein